MRQWRRTSAYAANYTGILGELMVPQHAVGDRGHRDVVLLTQLAEAVEIARAGGFNQFDLGVDHLPSRPRPCCSAFTLLSGFGVRSRREKSFFSAGLRT